MRSKRLRATVPFDKRITNKSQGGEDDSEISQTGLRRGNKLGMSSKPAEKAVLKSTKSTSSSGQHNHTRRIPDYVLATSIPHELAKQHPVVIKYMTEQGFLDPMPVQVQVWTKGCAGKDVIAQVCSPWLPHGLGTLLENPTSAYAASCANTCTTSHQVCTTNVEYM
jgi:hypothetical protein